MVLWIWRNTFKYIYIDKIFLYAKDPFEAKYLIRKCEIVGGKLYDDPECSNDMQDVSKNIEEYNLWKNIVIVSDDITDDMINNKKLNPVVTELFIRRRKLNISIVFIT